MKDSIQTSAEKLKVGGCVLAVLEDVRNGAKKLVPGRNIVTNDGDKYYAQMGCGEAPTADFDGAFAGLRMGTGITTPTKTDTSVTVFATGGTMGLDAGYEKTNDVDADNTGAGVNIVTWRYSFGTAQANITNIAEGAICVNVAVGGTALTHFLFAAAFNKTANDTLKVFVNHELLGA